MDDYELSADDFAILDTIFRHWLGSNVADANRVFTMNVRDLHDRFTAAHTAKILYE